MMITVFSTFSKIDFRPRLSVTDERGLFFNPNRSLAIWDKNYEQ